MFYEPTRTNWLGLACQTTQIQMITVPTCQKVSIHFQYKTLQRPRPQKIIKYQKCIGPIEQAIKNITLLLKYISPYCKLPYVYRLETKITTCSKPFYRQYSSLTGLITTAFRQRSTSISMKRLMYNVLWDSPGGEKGSL